MSERLTAAERVENEMVILDLERQNRAFALRVRRDAAHFKAHEQALQAAMSVYIGMLEGQMRAIMWSIDQVAARRG